MFNTPVELREVMIEKAGIKTLNFILTQQKIIINTIYHVIESFEDT